MKKIVVLSDAYAYKEDCKRIKKVFADKGYDITVDQAENLWSKYSDSMCAGWLFLPKDDEEIFLNVNAYWKEDDSCSHEYDPIYEDGTMCVDCGYLAPLVGPA